MIYNDASCWQSLMFFVMVGFDLGSAFDPMSNHGVRSGVAWLDSMVADEAKIHLVVFAWNATMVQAKTLNHEVNESKVFASILSFFRCLCYQ